jgi:hypothetical protein
LAGPAACCSDLIPGRLQAGRAHALLDADG